MTVFRIYEPFELGSDGYPRAWHNIELDPDTIDTIAPGARELGITSAGFGVKDLVRAQAGHRCVRCGHPTQKGRVEWEHAAGVDADSKALAEQGMFSFGRSHIEAPQAGKRPTLWSPCDDQCRHGGPLRVDGEPWPGALTPMGVVGTKALREGTRRVEASWRILTVHHLNGRKHDLRWWNLCSLCQRCHLIIQNKVLMEQIWPAEHSEWFRPYAAGWYSYAYEGRELTREEVMDDLDRLLALERAV